MGDSRQVLVFLIFVKLEIVEEVSDDECKSLFIVDSRLLLEDLVEINFELEKNKKVCCGWQ